MIDQLYQDSLLRIAAANPEFSEFEIEEAANDERRELLFFTNVMSHIYEFNDW